MCLAYINVGNSWVFGRMRFAKRKNERAPVFPRRPFLESLRFCEQIPLFSPLLLHYLLLSFPRYEINLDPLIQCDRDSLKHRKRMPFIVRIFEPCNYGLF